MKQAVITLTEKHELDRWLEFSRNEDAIEKQEAKLADLKKSEAQWFKKLGKRKLEYEDLMNKIHSAEREQKGILMLKTIAYTGSTEYITLNVNQLDEKAKQKLRKNLRVPPPPPPPPPPKRPINEDILPKKWWKFW